LTLPVVPEPPRVASIDTSNTYSNSTRTELSFSMPSSGDNQISVLWAMSRANPRNPSPDATLLQHAWRGLEFMNMDEEFDGSVVTEASPFPVHGKTYKDNGRPSFVLIAHIVCGVFATMLALPGGVVVPRLTRGLTTSRWWFPFHAINQGVTALALVCAAFGVALGFGGEFDTNHRKMGVVLFALIIVQTILGLFSHFCKPGPRLRPYTFETKRGRGPTNFMHVALGIVCVGVGWSLSWTGE
jgi:hypothetical protein